MDDSLSPRAQELRTATGLPGERHGLASNEPHDADGSRDALIMQVLSSEHFSLLSQRGLAYNEAFTRVGMLLTFVSMSLVALALLSSALPTTGDLLVIAAVVLGFDLVIGLATVNRVRSAYGEDFIAVQAMNRVRHGYLELAPEAAPYISMGTHDDWPGVVLSYASSIEPRSALAGLAYGFSTSIGLAMMVVALLAGAIGAVTTLAIGASAVASLAAGVAATLIVIIALVWIGSREQVRSQSSFEVRFPSPAPRPTDAGA